MCWTNRGLHTQASVAKGGGPLEGSPQQSPRTQWERPGSELGLQAQLQAEGRPRGAALLEGFLQQTSGGQQGSWCPAGSCGSGRWCSWRYSVELLSLPAPPHWLS